MIALLARRLALTVLSLVCSFAALLVSERAVAGRAPSR